MIDAADWPHLDIATANQPRPSLEQPRLADQAWARRLLSHPTIAFLILFSVVPSLRLLTPPLADYLVHIFSLLSFRPTHVVQ